MKKTIKKAKTKVISKKRGPKIVQVKSLGTELSVDTLREKLGDMLGKVRATGKKKNPWFAESADGKNNAFGMTQADALNNLFIGITNRKF